MKSITSNGKKLNQLLAVARPVALLLAMLLLWEAAVRLFAVPAYLVPTPWDVLGQIVAEYPRLLAETAVTTMATLGGFALSVLVGVPLGVAIAYSKFAERYVYPLLVFSQSVPKVAIAPLFVVWFGFGAFPKVLTAFLLAVFPVVVSTVTGFRSIDPEYANLAKSMRATAPRAFWLLNLPMAMPAIFSGLKIAVTLAVVGAVVGEFVGSNSGIGYLLQVANGNFDLPLMFAALVVLSLVGVVLFMVVELAERVFLPWHASNRAP